MAAVTFVMPAFKRHYIREAVDSILAQTFRDFELLVVDDGSPEDLFAALRDLGSWQNVGDEQCAIVNGVPLRYYRNPQNLGGADLVMAWNHALGRANSEWCVLAGDDDVYDARFLEELMELTKRYPTCDLFHSRSAKVDATGKTFEVSDHIVEKASSIQMMYLRGEKGLTITAQEYLFRLSAMKKMGGFVNFPKAWHSDVATWLAMSKNGVCCAPEILFKWRCSGENISSRHDDILEKVRASELFCAWLHEFCQKLIATSEEERFILENIERIFIGNVRGYDRILISETPLWVWWRDFIISSRFTIGQKARFIRDRFGG